MIRQSISVSLPCHFFVIACLSLLWEMGGGRRREIRDFFVVFLTVGS